MKNIRFFIWKLSFFVVKFSIYSITSMARTRMARLPWMIWTLFSVPTKSSQYSRKQIFRDFFFLFYYGIVCCVYSLESPHRHSSYNHCVENRKVSPKLSLQCICSWTGAMINPQWLELPMSRTNFHGPKDVRAIEVRLYLNRRVFVMISPHCSFV